MLYIKSTNFYEIVTKTLPVVGLTKIHDTTREFPAQAKKINKVIELFNKSRLNSALASVSTKLTLHTAL